jgi:hypothetical protein
MTHEIVGTHAWCANCGGEPPADLLTLARTARHHAEPPHAFLALAHCCACAEGVCPCGGYVTVADLEALADAFGDAADFDTFTGRVGARPFRREVYWEAAMVSQVLHADHQSPCWGAGPPIVVCEA